MRLFLLLFITVFAYSAEKGIIIDQSFMTTDIYQDGVTYNIVSFTYDESIPSPDMYEEDNATEPEQNIKIGIVSSGNILVDLIWEYQSLSNEIQNNIIQSVELIDLNNDNQIDIVIHYNDSDSDFPDQIISSFLINKNKTWSPDSH